uniref:Uncharacterized protein n=1 Tax=Arion vulgaris TaxID=1028688 RepID=A0A0B6ZSF0_9EUPU
MFTVLLIERHNVLSVNCSAKPAHQRQQDKLGIKGAARYLCVWGQQDECGCVCV